MSVNLTSFSEMRSFTEQPVMLRVLWAISGLKRPRKDLFSSHSNLCRKFIFLVVTCPQNAQVIHEDDQFLPNIYI